MSELNAKKCARCGEKIEANAKFCPHCGAPVAAVQAPKTVFELRQFCEDRGMPLEKMRFFLGRDCREPKAFGIFKDDEGDYIVYKNKADGARVVHYRGADESKAVSELYEKILSEIDLRVKSGKLAGSVRDKAEYKEKPAAKPEQEDEDEEEERPESHAAASASDAPKKKRGYGGLIVFGAIVLAFLSLILFGKKSPKTGYYDYAGKYFYCQKGDWFAYDEEHGWGSVSPDPLLEKNHKKFFVGRDYNVSLGVTDFAESEFYVESGKKAETPEPDGSGPENYGSWDNEDTDWDDDW